MPLTTSYGLRFSARFDFTTEVSGFFVRRLSVPSDATCPVVDNQAAGECCPLVVASDRVDPETDRDASGTGAATTSAASATEPSKESGVLHNPPTLVSGAIVRDSAGGHADGGPASDGGGEGATRTEPAAEGTSVLAESSASKALWKRARPRVRYFTHQVRRESVVRFLDKTRHSVARYHRERWKCVALGTGWGRHLRSCASPKEGSASCAGVLVPSATARCPRPCECWVVAAAFLRGFSEMLCFSAVASCDRLLFDVVVVEGGGPDGVGKSTLLSP